MRSALDLTGTRFGRLVALNRGPDHQAPSRKQVTWVCVCDCGNIVTVQRGALQYGSVQSCGCLRKDLDSEKSRKSKDRKSEYNCWASMKQRCLNSNDKYFYAYGERGISVCERWARSFDAFYDDMGSRPSDKHSLDRIDTNKGYEPGNCRWATAYVQSRNKRNNVFIEFRGERKVLADWARDIGIHWSSLYERLQKYPLEIALTSKKGMNHGS